MFQGVNKSQQDTFMQWCEQTLHTLNTANNLDGTSLKICFAKSLHPLLLTGQFWEPNSEIFSICFPASSYFRFLPERSGLSVRGARLHQGLFGGHSRGQGLCQAVPGTSCQTEREPTETGTAEPTASPQTAAGEHDCSYQLRKGSAYGHQMLRSLFVCLVNPREARNRIKTVFLFLP